MTGAPLIHLVCGSTGAGKSTFARKLEQDEGALRFSIDEWMMRLYGPDAPRELSFAWAKARVERCVAQMWEVARRHGAMGGASVFDTAFTTRAERDRVAEWAGEAGLPVRLHFLDVPAETRWTRVAARNEARGATFAFPVTRGMFDFVETIWEPPTADEMAALDGVRVGG